MNRLQSRIIGEVEYDNVQDEGWVSSLDFMLRSNVDGYGILPLFKLLIYLPNSIQQSAIGLFGRLCRVQLLVYFALDHGECAHQTKEIDLRLPIPQGNVTDIVHWIFARQLDVHVIVILSGRAARSQADTVAVSKIKLRKDEKLLNSLSRM